MAEDPQSLLQRAAGLAKAGEPAAALDLCQAVLKREGKNVRALFMGGNCAMALGDHDLAVRWLKRAAKIETASPEIFNNFGAALLNAHQPQEAADAFASALALRPDYANAHVNLANAQKALGDFEAAAAHLRDAMKLAGDDALSGELAEVLGAAKRHGEAARLREKILRRDPADHECRAALVTSLLRAGEADKAKAAAEADPAQGAARAAHLTACGEAMSDHGQPLMAADILEQAVAADADHLPARSLLDSLYRRAVPRWHFSMLNDAPRNDAYDRAIRKAVRAGDVVLDIGAGSGLLAMMAVRAGAAHVYACEGVDLIARKAREIVAANGFTDTITILPKWSNDIVIGEDMPKKADVLISEIVDNVLIGEGIIPSLKHAHAELVAEGARAIPAGGAIHLMAFESQGIAEMGLAGTAAGFDVSGFNEFSRYGYISPGARAAPMRALSAPETAFRFDFSRAIADAAPETREIGLTITADGLLNGAVAWIELALDGETAIGEPPDGGHSHWLPAWFLCETPKPVSKGDTVTVVAGHDLANFHLLVAGK